MFKNMSGARLGLFVFLGTVLLIIIIFLIGNKSALFSSTFTVKTYFNDIAGLRTGAVVRFSGIDVGSVDNIEIASDTSGIVLVTLSIEENVHHFIKVDSEASIETEGLVGNKLIVVSAGSNSAPIVQEDGFIRSRDPLNMAAIIEQGEGTLAYIKEISKDFSEIVNKINRGEGTIGKIINDDQLYNAAAQITESADKSLNSITTRLEEVSDVIEDITTDFSTLIAGLDTAVSNINGLVLSVKQGKGVVGQLVSENSTLDDSIKAVMTNLVTTTSQIKEGAVKFAENMEALKHNWLFKGYFEQRGYWDISEYEKNLDGKISELKERTRVLDEKIKELKSLEKTTSSNK